MDAATLAGFKFDLPLKRGGKRSESAPTSELSHVAAKLYERADDIERNWSSFSNEEKEIDVHNFGIQGFRRKAKPDEAGSLQS